MNTAKNSVGEIFGLDRVGDAIVYTGLDRDYRRDVISPEYTLAATRIVDAWMKRGGSDFQDVDRAVEAMADKLIDGDLMRAARLDAFRRRRECLVEDIRVPALCGKPGVQVGEPVSMQLQKIRAFVQAEAVKHLR